MSDGTIGTLSIISSVFFDVFANICLKKSQGFKYKLYGFLAKCCESFYETRFC